MNRLLIVDDESHIVDWLYEMFKSESGLTLDVYKAYNGEEAVGWLNRTYIDIVLADIHMPEMDGLSLLREVKNRWPFCKVIFLTGYDSFDYIYESNKYDGVKYLLKSENDQTIINTVAEAINEIEKGSRNREIITKAKADLKRAIPMMRGEFLSDMVDGVTGAEELTEDVFRSLEIPLLPGHEVLTMVTYLDFNSWEKTPARKTNSLYIMESVLENFLGPKIQYTAMVHDRSYIICFFQPVEDLRKFPDGCVPAAIWNLAISRLKGVLDQVQASCSRIFGARVSFAVSESPCSWNTVPRKYAALRKLLNMYSGSDSEAIISESMQSVKGGMYAGDETADLTGGIALSSRLQVLSSLIESGRREEFFTLLSGICDPLTEVKSMNFMPAIEIYTASAICLLSYINTYQLWEKIAFRCALFKLVSYREHGSWAQAVQFLTSVAEIIFEIKESEQQLRAEYTVTRLKKYIRDNLSDELSIFILGEAMHFNPVYLSRIFRQSAGINLSSYITGLRIEKAKELLEDHENKINEIAKKVGCASSNYFSRLFKKMTGMTPQQYRDKVVFFN